MRVIDLDLASRLSIRGKLLLIGLLTSVVALLLAGAAFVAYEHLRHEDPVVIEVMLNPDGRIWLDRLGEGLADSGANLSAADGERPHFPRLWG